MSGNKGKNKPGNIIISFFILSIVVDFFVWYRVIFGGYESKPKAYFLDVGQGDAELVIFPGNTKILTDAGPDSKIVGELEKIQELAGKYIDLAVITHPQLDHFNGFLGLLDRYNFGAFIYNGRSDSQEGWSELIAKIKEKKIPLIALKAGDVIKNGENRINFLSPDENLLGSAELNDTGLVQLTDISGLKMLLAADIGGEIEKYLAENFDLKADVLKVAHHGSKFSSSEEFLKAVGSRVAIIEVGENNKYGHPASSTLEKLSDFSPAILRTDVNGQIMALLDNEKLKIFAEKE